MPAKHRSTYRSQPRGKAEPIPRLHLALNLTASEIRKLKALAVHDMRPMSECIAGLVSKHLARKSWTAPKLAASRRVRRFEVATRIPKDELERLTELAEAEGRSLSVASPVKRVQSQG